MWRPPSRNDALSIELEPSGIAWRKWRTRTHAQKIVGKKVVLLAASRSGSGYPKKTSLA
ncbi:unnamed protein product [Ectocarpus sp. CCAP 1310/34]|nr:unnamed protein product [Ectocarpus sp. CCAP 1310/34]